MTKVEEVARAISKYLGENPDEHDNNVADGLFYANWTAHEGLARAAIKAMREPTFAMHGAALKIRCRPQDECPSELEIYAAMIDAALAEDK